MRSSDLKAPLALEFEVRARLVRGWITGVVVAGILVAWWLRIDGLAPLEALRDALLRGSDADISACRDRAKAAVDMADGKLREALASATQHLAERRELPAGRGTLPAPLQAANDALDEPCTAAAAEQADVGAGRGAR